VDWKLEVIVVPVADVDRAKQFYAERVGFHVDVDFSAGEDFRIVQLTPTGSACSVTLMRAEEGTSPIKGLQVTVADIDTARGELLGRGVEATEVFHFVDGKQTPGHEPDRADYGTFFSFADPDGNIWLIQEVPSRGGAAA
jgi:catechol 2,3-dioxygenase-like lactoylglutathione lyase family enzyme